MRKAALYGFIGFVVAGCGFDVGQGNEDAVGRVSTAISATSQLRQVALSTGVRLEYLVQGAKHGEPVIFLHGYTDSHRAFTRNLDIFPRKYRVYAPDQRGHGSSSRPECCFKPVDFAQDVAAFMDALGIEKASIVGHSMGSFVAQKVAIDFPERVNKLILIGSAPTVAGNAGALELLSFVDTLEEPIDPEFVHAFQAGTFFRAVPDAFLDTAVEESLRVPARIWQQTLAELIAHDAPEALQHIEAETLILYGDQDVFFTLDEQVALEASIPNAVLVVFEQAGHGLQAELPRPVVRQIQRFLR